MRRRSARTNSSCHPHARRPGRSAPVESSDLRQPAGDTRPPSRSRPCHGRVGVRCRARAGMAQVTEHAPEDHDVELLFGPSRRSSFRCRARSYRPCVGGCPRRRVGIRRRSRLAHTHRRPARSADATRSRYWRPAPPPDPAWGLSGATPTPRAGIERCRERPAVRLPSQCTGGARGPTDVDRPA